MITPDDIRWLKSGKADGAPPGTVSCCPVCGANGRHSPVLQVPSMSPPHPMLTLLHCAQCESMHYDPPGVADFADLSANSDEFWRYYVEVGAGVWETIWPTLAERTAGAGDMLDVGCGFGFAVDFWRQMSGGDSVGVELADYGQVGARLLGVPIYNQRLQDCQELADRQFDVVYASEVIEHVPDPNAFVALLAKFVAQDGLLVMTTPCSEYIERKEHSTTLLTALAPGFHGFLLSPRAFAAMARRCGFQHVDVRRFGERQILWASRRSLDVRPQEPALRAAYLNYLDRRVATLESSSPAWQGLAYRYVKELINSGRLVEANKLVSALMAVLQRSYGPAIGNPTTALERVRGCTTLAEYGQAIPYFTPCLYYFLGALAQHHDRDTALASRYYLAAAEFVLECRRFGSVFFLEAISLLWPARARYAEILLAQGDLDAGVALFARIADEGGRCDARNAFALAPRDLMEVTIPQLCDQFWEAGYRAHANTLFGAYARYVQTEYGAAALTAAGVEVALSSGSGSLPLDPLFASYFAARDSMPGDTALAELAMVSRVGTIQANHPTHGSRSYELANRARGLLRTDPAAGLRQGPSTPLFEMTYDYKMRRADN